MPRKKAVTRPDLVTILPLYAISARMPITKKTISTLNGSSGNMGIHLRGYYQINSRYRISQGIDRHRLCSFAELSSIQL